MNLMQLFYIIWMWILPILGVTTPTVGLLLYIFAVPKVAKTFIWNKFRNVTMHLVGDNAGYAEIVPSKIELPEGIHRTKKGWWHFLPKPALNPTTTANLAAERLTQKTYILKGFGKPIVIDYAGKLTSMNLGTLAALQQNNKGIDLEPYFTNIEKLLKDLPQSAKHWGKEITKKLKELKTATESEPVTNIDVEVVKEVVNQKYPPSQIDALAQNRLEKGKRMRGRDYTSLIIGGAILLVILIFGIIAMMVFFG